MVKHMSTMWESWVQSLGWEDPLEKEMATHSSTLAWRIPWMDKPGGLQSMGSQRVRCDFTFTVYKGLKSSVSGNGIQTAINVFLLFHSSISFASVSSKHLGPHFCVGAGKRTVGHHYLGDALC